MMNIKIFKFLKICEELNLKDKFINLNDNFNTRLLIQKAFYFLTKLGFPFRIKFNFYKYGPNFIIEARN